MLLLRCCVLLLRAEGRDDGGGPGCAYSLSAGIPLPVWSRGCGEGGVVGWKGGDDGGEERRGEVRWGEVRERES